MDKIGPICRSVEDCAIVMSVIHGQDGHDLSVQAAAFNWDAGFDWKKLKVGYVKSAFDEEPLAADATAQQKAQYARRAYDAKFNTAALAALRKMGVTLIPVEMPKFPFGSVTPLLQAEAGRGVRRADADWTRCAADEPGGRRLADAVPDRAFLLGGGLHPGDAGEDTGDCGDGWAVQAGGCGGDAFVGSAELGDKSYRAAGGDCAEWGAGRGLPRGSGGRWGWWRTAAGRGGHAGVTYVSGWALLGRAGGGAG